MQPTILCVATDAPHTLARRLALESSGYNVLTAATAEQALRRYESSSIDAVILACEIPDIDTGQLASQLTSLDPNVPKLLLIRGEVFPEASNAVVEDFCSALDGAQTLRPGNCGKRLDGCAARCVNSSPLPAKKAAAKRPRFRNILARPPSFDGTHSFRVHAAEQGSALWLEGVVPFSKMSTNRRIGAPLLRHPGEPPR